MNIISRIRKSYITKGIAVMVAMNMIAEIAYPTAALAITTGPSQPEVQSFEPVETTDMVNLFTGDFTYNIPLLYLPGPNGGYPINLAYHGGVGMEQEASWVGLGWNINAGALVRNVRGYADDYDGDQVIKKYDMNPNYTWGLQYGHSQQEIVGGPVGGMNLGIRWNNYKGFGVSVGYSFPLGSGDNFSMGLSLDSETGLGLSVRYNWESEFNKSYNSSVGLTYDNEGLGLDLSRSNQIGDKKVSNIPTTQGFHHEQQHNGSIMNPTMVAAGSSSLGFSANTHAPIISMPVKTENHSISFKTGAETAPGIFSNNSYSGFFNIQMIPEYQRGVDLYYDVYGYENLENATDPDLMDFTREKDGTVTPMTPNLAAPNLTYDTYIANGQGIQGYFRPFRTDVGRVHDPEIYNTVSGNSYNFDIGSGHLGVGMAVTVGHNLTRPWDYKNDWSQNFENFQTNDFVNVGSYATKYRERVYYKMHGDKATLHEDELSYIGGEDAVQSDVSTQIFDKLDQLHVPAGIQNQRTQWNSERIPRNRLVHKLSNAEITMLYDNNQNIETPNDLTQYPTIDETNIFYYDWSSGEGWLPTTGTSPTDPSTFLNRFERGDQRSIAGQNGAHKVLNENGQYYVYGLPAYNNKEVEVSFSVDDTDVENVGTLPVEAALLVDFNTTGSGPTEEVDYKLTGTHEYLSRTEKPPYAHSYLLTSILGADYVDLQQDGITDDDLGYWVKFDYVKYCDDYKWRSPYQGALYNPGLMTTDQDDKGTYVYGEKELWYVSRIETKTHILVFDLAERNDNFEAEGEFSKLDNIDPTTNSGLLIEKISLYLKEDYENNAVEEAVPLKEVHFKYSYKLCGLVENYLGSNYPNCVNQNDSTFKGKLTLTEVYITSQGSSKGASHPYKFEYYNEPGSSEGVELYDKYSFDRWGNFKPTNGFDAVFKNKYLPYVNQFEDQATADANASKWSLKTVHLPSGGQIDIDYEADDYAHVQNEVATQMLPITKVNDADPESNKLYEHNNYSSNYVDDPRTRRVYFKLVDPILTSDPAYDTPEEQAEKIYRDYIENLIVDGKGDRNLYFKNYTQLRAGEPDSYSYVSGYVPIVEYNEDQIWTLAHAGNNYYKYGLSDAVNGYYTQGFITIKKHIRKIDYDEMGNFIDLKTSDKYHPMAIAAWEHMRLNDPLMLTSLAGLNITGTGANSSNAQQVTSLFGFIPQTIQMFTGVWAHCRNNEYAREINVADERSVIRLCSPNKKKRGGGHRVKQISVSDNWNSFTGEANSVYGVTYDYTKTEESNGGTKTISSGVAQYEPMLGGDEIALRHPRFFVDNVPFNSDQRSYFEYPINQQYFPAPTVGYSKVTVKSLNTKNQMEASTHQGEGTSGVTEYEFYTSKDFPVIVKEKPIIKAKFNVPIPIPFIGIIERKKIKAAQGYVIELNDMHGKIKSIKQYGLKNDYTKSPYTTSSVEYRYLEDDYLMSINSEYTHQVKRLINTVETLNHDDNSGTPSTSQKMIGVEFDFMTDQRQSISHTMIIGLNTNIDVVPPLALPSFWPQFTSVKRDLKTFTTNKVIFKSGILSEVHTYDGTARVIQKNEVYDEKSGRVIITSVNNEFEDEIYNYSHPAHWEYEGMGHAYKNINFEFTADIIDKKGVSGLNGQFVIQTDNTALVRLVPGDEFLVTYVDGGSTKCFKATYIADINSTTGIIHASSKNGSYAHADFLVGGTSATFKVIRSGRRNHVFTDAGSIAAFEMPVITPSNSSTSRGTDLYSGTVDVAGYSIPVSFDKNRMDNVLNSMAVVFKDEWENNGGNNNENPFATGEAGIWRPYKSYVYVGTRNVGEDPSIIPTVKTNIRDNGKMNNAYFFNWQIQNFEQFTPEWQWTTEITKFNSEAYELENVNRLNILSSALYGYDGSLVLAIGSNAGYHEIGVEDFERYQAGSNTDLGTMNADDNLEFFNLHTSGPMSDMVERTYRIVGGKSLASGKFQVELETQEAFNLGDKVEVALATSNFNSGGKSESYIFTTTVTNIPASSGNTILELQSKHHFQVSGQYYSLLGQDNLVTGRATVSVKKELNDLGTNTTTLAYVQNKAHTGDMSLRFNEGQSGLGYMMAQGKIDLIKDKTYTFSAWVSRDDINTIDFEDITLDVKEFDGQFWNSIQDVSSFRKSKVVEGWQKIEFDFTPIVSNSVIAIYLKSQLNGVGIDSYIDDIRISPKTGGIVTYVYDNDNFRLKATLNEDNYATFYFYDEEGNLHLLKRETERGIQTISENRGNNRKVQ
ncbi:MAG: hypothetical protein HUJ25_11795 [Crocinitomicaceae bacterium]|nr:hypothetical protein [Crocinitomicaceae bacterium]